MADEHASNPGWWIALCAFAAAVWRWVTRSDRQMKAANRELWRLIAELREEVKVLKDENEKLRTQRDDIAELAIQLRTELAEAKLARCQHCPNAPNGFLPL